MIPEVVILGVGYAGGLIAHELEEAAIKGLISLTTIERREDLHLKIGSIRASVQGGEWIQKIRVPIRQILKHGKNIVGDIERIDEESKLIHFSDPHMKPVHFDILICATGTTSHSSGDLPPGVNSREEIQDYFDKISSSIKEAKNIFIVGGGPSAVEFAGEIRDIYHDKPITIICSTSQLLSSSIAPISPKFIRHLVATLKDRNIEVIYNEKVIKPTHKDCGLQKVMSGPVEVITNGEKCLKLNTDLLIWAASWNLDSSIYPDRWLNELGEISVKPTFQQVETSHVFAIGDITSLAETKQAITLPPKIPILKYNILKVAELMRHGKYVAESVLDGLKHYQVTDKVKMFLPVGKEHGVSQVSWWIYGSKSTSKMKGIDLYTNHFWKLLTGTKAPSLTNS